MAIEVNRRYLISATRRNVCRAEATESGLILLLRRIVTIPIPKPIDVLICAELPRMRREPQKRDTSKRSRKTDNDSVTMNENNTRVQFSNRFWNVAWDRTKYHYVILFGCDPSFTVVAIRIATQQKLPTCRKDLGVIGVIKLVSSNLRVNARKTKNRNDQQESQQSISDRAPHVL
jgi:hypothetical protein